MTAKPAAILAATLIPGNAAFERLTKPSQEKLVTLAALFANADSITQSMLLAAIAPEVAPASQATTFKRLQENLQMFAVDAKLLLRLALSADGTASLEANAEPTPVEKLAAAMLSLDARGLTPPRVEATPDFHVFVSLAHEEKKKDAAQMALIAKIEKRTKLLASNIGHQGKVSFFSDPQIDASDPGITHRVTQEVSSANAFLVLLWGRYFERIVETDELNLIRDVELPSIKQRLTRTVLTAYGSLNELDRLRTTHFGDKLILNYSDPIQHEQDDAKREAYVNRVASALVTMIGRTEPPPASPPDEAETDGALQRRATALVPTVDAASAQPKAKTSSLSRDDVDTAPSNVNGTDLLPELHAWVRKAGVSPFCAVLGETGQGKTTAMQMFARELLDARKKKSAGTQPPLPIYIDLRKYPYHADDSIETLLTRVLSESGDVGAATPEALRDMLAALHQGELVVIFDGLDERTVGMSREQATHFIQQLWRIFPNDRLIAWRDYFSSLSTFRAEARRESEASEKAGLSTGHKVLQGPKPPPPMGKMLLTCRTHYFRDLAELNGMLLDNFRGDSESADFSVYRLLPFNEEQIRHYLKAKLPTRDPDAVMALFCRVHNLRELVERPLLLSFIVKRIDRIETISAASGQEFLTLHIYRDIVADWLTRDDPKHKFASEYKPLLMESLACELWKKRARTLSVEKLSTWLDTFFSTHPHIDNAHNRIDRELLKEDLRTATFIVHSARGQSQPSGAAKRTGDASEYSFAHTSFLEYFLAGAIGRQLVADKLDESLFKLAPPSLEAARFLAEWRVAADEDDAESFDVALSARLASHAPAANGWLFQVFLHLHALGIAITMPTPICLRDADLTGGTIRGVPHRWLNLRGANFSGATLTDSDWAFADARGANFTGAWVGGASFEAVHLVPDALDDAAWRGGVRFRKPGAARATLDAKRVGTLQPVFDTGYRWVSSAYFDASRALIVSTSGNNTAKLWSIATGFCVHTLCGHRNEVRSAAFDATGTLIVTASDDSTIKLWNVATGACVQTLHGHQGQALSAEFDRSGTFIISASSDNTVKLWNVATGACVQTLFEHLGSPLSAAFDTTGAVVVEACDDNTLRVWNVATGTCMETLSGHQGQVQSAAFDSTGALVVSASADSTIKLWNVAAGSCVQTLSGHQKGVQSAAFDRSGAFIVSASDDSTIKLWNVATGSCVQTFFGHQGNVLCAAFDSSGTIIVSASRDNTVKLWNVATGACVQTLSGQRRSVESAAFDRSGAFIVCASSDSTVKLLNVATGACVQTFSGHRRAVRSAAFDATGAFIVSASDDSTIKLWNVATGACVQTFSGSDFGTRSAAFDATGVSIVSASGSGRINLWNAGTGVRVQTMSGYLSHALSAAFDSSGAFVVSALSDNTVRLWNVATGANVQTFSGHEGSVRSAAFDDSGAYIVSASGDSTVKLWNIATGVCMRTFSGHEGRVNSAAFDSRGAFVVSASSDNTVKLWVVATGACVQTFSGHQGRVQSAVFDSSGAFIVSASADGTMRTWNAKTGACIRVFTLLPLQQWTTVDVAAKRFIAASPGAWRTIGYLDENGHEIEAEAVDPIAGMEWPTDMRVPA